MDDVVIALLVSVGTMLIFFMVLMVMLNLYVAVPAPSELLVVSGRRYRAEDGTEVGYRIAHKTVIVMPIVERVDRLDLRAHGALLDLQAYAKGGAFVRLELTALVAICPTSPQSFAATERFLGRDPKEVVQVAKETLEGAVRGVVAQSTPLEMHQDRVLFVQTVVSEVEDDFRKLGLELLHLGLTKLESPTFEASDKVTA